MKISWKIGSIVVLLLLPIGVLTWVVVKQGNKDIDFAAKEILGDSYLRAIWPVHDALADRTTGGAGASAHLADLKAAGALYAEGLNSTDLAAKVAATLADPSADVAAKQTAVSDLITRVGNESNLILDPDLDSYYAMDIVLLKQPATASSASRLYDRVADLGTSPSAEAGEAVAVQVGQFKDLVAGTFVSLDAVYEYDSGNNQKAELSAVSTAYQAAADRYLAAAHDAVAALRAGSAPAGILGKLASEERQFAAANTAFWRKTVDRLDVMLERRIERLESTLYELLAFAGVITLIALGFSLHIGRSIGRAIHRSVSEMLALAGGATDIAISGHGRRDEIGDIAGALTVFRDNALEKLRLEEHEKARSAELAAERHATAAAIADRFRGAIGGIVGNLMTHATDLEQAAALMSRSAAETSEQAGAVASASEEASAAVQSVAGATEELSVSVREISSQVGLSTGKANAAVEAAGHTVGRVNSLAEASDKIGAIVGLIQDIAEQTNLLALNATIEAARAGEAGKGFAVVAAEVKGLAAQTARATTEISQQIGGIQTATAESVSAITSITALIHDLANIADVIAQGVEQQASATNEISSNIQTASVSSSSVSANIVGVSASAGQSSEAASKVLRSSAVLSSESARLRQEVDGFLATLNAA